MIKIPIHRHPHVSLTSAGRNRFTDWLWQTYGVRSAACSIVQRGSISIAVLNTAFSSSVRKSKCWTEPLSRPRRQPLFTAERFRSISRLSASAELSTRRAAVPLPPSGSRSWPAVGEAISAEIDGQVRCPASADLKADQTDHGQPVLSDDRTGKRAALSGTETGSLMMASGMIWQKAVVSAFPRPSNLWRYSAPAEPTPETASARSSRSAQYQTASKAVSHSTPSTCRPQTYPHALQHI